MDDEPVLAGIRTDKVHEVTTLQRVHGEPPPSVGMRWRPDFIGCLVKRDAEFIIIPNLQAIFTASHSRSTPMALQS